MIASHTSFWLAQEGTILRLFKRIKKLFECLLGWYR